MLDVLSAWLEADPSPAHVMGGDTQWEGWAGASTPANPHLGAPSMDRTRPHPHAHAPSSSSGGDDGGDDGDDNVATSRRREVVIVCATNGQ